MASIGIFARLAASVLAWAALGGAAPGSPLHWTPADAAALVEIIGRVDDEGLDPQDYGAPAIEAAIARGDAMAIDEAATAAAMELAGDYWAGRVPPRERAGWYIAGPVRTDPALRARIEAGLRARHLPATFAAMLPTHPDYRRLRAALADSGDGPRRAQIRVNMERWRWMPRDLGGRHLLVNVPAFELKLVDGDRVADERAVIVGKRATPTPTFSSRVDAVILNPWWEVPKSIVAESVGALVRRSPAKAAAQGYVVHALPDGSLRYRQKPGPHNALGQMKLVMPNRFSVYLHDTPSRGRFEQDDRALSHGCIRVKGAVDFAALLLAEDPAWDRAAIDRVLAGGQTVKVPLRRPLPVHIAYFTVATRGDELAFHGDPYRRDAGVLGALDRGRPVAIAARAEPTCPA